jgi:type IV secretion system protein VirD4
MWTGAVERSLAGIAGLVPLAYVAGILAQAMKAYLAWLRVRQWPDAGLKFSFRAVTENLLSMHGMAALIMLVGICSLVCGKFRLGNRQDPRKFSVSRMDTYGTAGWLALEEARAVLRIKNIHNTDGILLGAVDGSIVSLPHDTLFNRHIAVFGASGSMKSRAFVRNNILQLTRAGRSMVLTDPKGELFADMAEFLRDQGYTVKLLNLVRPELSDAWNCLGEIGGDELMAQTFADVVIANTRAIGRSGGDPFWDRAEMNLLKALVLYVDLEYPEETRNMGGVYNLLAASDVSAVDSIFSKLPARHPARAPYNIYRQAGDSVRTGVIIGLGTRLQVFQNALIRRMTARRDIDLSLPGRERCAYFCIMSDQDSTLDFLSSLFFSFLFIKLVRQADHNNSQADPEVFMIMDEFPNIGQIPDFTKKISTIRSRGIHCAIIFQNIPQLSNRYPLNAWQEILGNCDTQVFLGCTDIITAEHVSQLTGQVTVDLESTQRPRGPAAWHDFGRSTRSVGKRFLLNPDEVLRLPREAEILFLRGQKPMLLTKFDYINHPLSRRLKPSPVSEYKPGPGKKITAVQTNTNDQEKLKETKPGIKGGFF